MDNVALFTNIPESTKHREHEHHLCKVATKIDSKSLRKIVTVLSIPLYELALRTKLQRDSKTFTRTQTHPSITEPPSSIFTNPTLIELRQEIGQYDWLASPKADDLGLCSRAYTFY
ncbi:hypothetical protein AVEN_196334-1 [Araneus ventricosus]|uniref:Uncharacterized protein n=1 Tax=Araneus ventricosus TaxID=182803 RepID=A0A4Y2AWE5_ARAVE|nr:hypothetical protein AVEN_196334-1 [Araneus ventricosus]